MPGYDPVRDAGGSDRSSPPPAHHLENGSRPSPSSSAHAQHAAIVHAEYSASQRSLSGNSLDRYGDSYAAGYGRLSSHDGVGAQVVVSPRSSTSALSLEPQGHSNHPAHDHAPSHRFQHSPRSSLYVDASPHLPRRSASIADLIAVSEMSEAEHNRHREAHRWSSQYGEDPIADRSMSRSSSASGGFPSTSASLAHSLSYHRVSPQIPRQTGRSERSPSMAHLLNEGTAGALQERPRSTSHSSVSSHIPHLPSQQHHPSQLSPAGHPASYPSQGMAADSQDRSAGPHPAGVGFYRVDSPTGVHTSAVQPHGLPTLNRGGSSPGLGPGHMGFPGERARNAAQASSARYGPVPRSGSSAYAYASASSSPASNQHVHLQPSPSHRFAEPEAPLARSPGSRRAPLPHSPTSAYTTQPRASLIHGAAAGWSSDEYEAASIGMPPPVVSASPRRGSVTSSINSAHRHPPTTPGNGVPPTPGSLTSYGGYPALPGSRSLPSYTPTSAYPRFGGDGNEESTYFPRMEGHAPSSYDQARERSASLTSPHLGQVEHPGHTVLHYETSSEHHRGYGDESNAIRTPGSSHYSSGAGRPSMRPPLSLPPPDMSPTYDARRPSHIPGVKRTIPISDEAAYIARDMLPTSVDRTYDAPDRDLDSSETRPHSSDHEAARSQHDSWTSNDPPLSLNADMPDDTRAAATRSHSRPSNEREAKSPPESAPLSKYTEDRVGATVDDSFKADGDVKEERTSTNAEAEDVGVVVPLPRYAPTRRVSQPRQVLRPIRIDEIDHKRARCRNPLRRQWEELHQADSREALDEILRDFHGKLAHVSGRDPTANGRDKSTTDTKKRTLGETLEDAEEVADHYNKRREVGIHGREESPIIALRKFNNWVKSVLVGTFARGRDPSMDGRGRARGGRILDLGCGKGGDLKKWEKVHPSGLVGADIATVSIEQAITRHRDNKNGFPGDFYAFDCFSAPLSEVIPQELLEPMFDNVTLQFCMHYAWESVQKARMMLDNVSRYLRRGGIFIGTIPDSRELRDRMTNSAHPENRSFGNRYYKVVFDQIEKWPAFGHRYTFFLEDAVENVPEYVVDFDVFEDLAHEVGLRCIYRKNFGEIYHEGSQHNEYGKLLERMKVVDRNGSLNLDEEMWQAATLYLGFAFEKM